MRAQTVGELIAKCYTLSVEEFLEIYPEPMLIGVGILDAMLLQHKDQRHSTLALGMDSSMNPDQTRHHLMGYLIPFCSRDGEPWERLSVGRTDHSDISIDDPAVSEVHAYIKQRGEDLLVGDLGSTNGTKINGVPLKAPQVHQFSDEDIVTFGRCSFQFFMPAVLYGYLSLGPH